MYFSEQGNVDDDATLITIFLVAFNLQQSAVCGLQSAVCKCHTPEFNKVAVVTGPELTFVLVLESVLL